MNRSPLLRLSIIVLAASLIHPVSIAFTAGDRSEDRAATKRAGFAAHLVKPVDPNELVTTILKVAKGH